FLLQAVLSGSGKALASSDVLSRKGLDSQQVKQAPDAGRTNSNGAALSAEAKASLEDLRTLLHLYSRLDKQRMVDSTAAQILARSPRDKETLELLASFYLERK